MTGWTVLTWGLVAGAGGLLFLKVVANRIAYGDGVLRRTEYREKRRQDRQIKAARDAEIIEAELAGGTEAA